MAWSRLQIEQQRNQWNSQIGRMNGVVFSHLLPLAYAYRSPGYRDWHRYADQARFQAALLAYLVPERKLRFIGRSPCLRIATAAHFQSTTNR